MANPHRGEISAVLEGEEKTLCLTLGALAESGIVRPRDLHYPFTQDYYYRREGERYVLMPPLY